MLQHLSGDILGVYLPAVAADACVVACGLLSGALPAEAAVL